jgi:hypothetical protein
MAISSTSFVNGQIGNPNGRPVGSRNRRTKEVIEQIIKSNNKDPLITLSEISSNDPDSAIRATAANMLAPYMHSKMQSTPAPRFVEESFDVPTFTHLSDAEQFLARIAALVSSGELDIQTGLELSTLAKNWIDIQYAREELAIKQYNAGSTEHEQTIRIEGGLPALPGTTITMPVLNGHAVSEQLLSAPKDVVPPDDGTNQVPSEAVTEFRPGELKAQGPHPLQERHFKDLGQNSGNGQGPEIEDGGTV